MSNPYLTVLRKYAQQSPESLPASILFHHSSKNITIFDAFPKSIFHFLVLPRIQEPTLNAKTLSSLQSLLNGDKEVAKQVISDIAADAQAVKKEIEEEMINRYGFKWDVWTGFHGTPSMEHIHLHVISADLCSDKLKHKKHYNSFHPKLGYFVHLDDVVSWLDAEPTFFTNMMAQIKRSKYEPILKEDLNCFHCERVMKNIPTLKAHLEEEWDKLESRAKSSAQRHLKRKAKEIESQSASKGDGNTLEESEQADSKKARSEALDDERTSV